MTYDQIYITNLPSFYKIRLYNAIALEKRILVIFTGDDSKSRNADFFSGDIKFESIFYKKQNLLYRVFFTLKLIYSLKYKELILGGWDSIPLILFTYLSNKHKNSIVIESSYHESQTNGLKGFIKRNLIKHIRNKAYVSGKDQKILIERLNFQGKIIKTKGVGIFNYIPQPSYVPKNRIQNFIYVGRLIEVKNLEFLIKFFNKKPELTLNIIGFGELEKYLKSIAKPNIIFHGAIDNKNLSSLYQQNDVFILPSKSEPWGLVVEEALNNGLPVLVSDKVGCASEIVNENNGLIFIYNSEKDLSEKIDTITDINYYNKLSENISHLDFESIEKEQIKCYL